jgi:hypothetical protein
MVVIQIVGGSQIRAGEPVVTIGSAADSHVAFLRDVRVAPQHAVIRQVAGRWLIESQGDGLICIGSGVPTKMGWLTGGEIIKLSASGPELIFDPPNAISAAACPASEINRASANADFRPTPARHVEPAPVAPVARLAPRQCDDFSQVSIVPASSRPFVAPNRQVLWVLVGGGLLAAGLMLGVFWSGLGGRGRSDSVAGGAGETAKAESGGRAETGEPGSRQDSRASVSPGNSAQGNSARSALTEETVTANRRERAPEAALCLIIVKHPEGGQVFQLGSAFAVAPGRLVTSGAVASELKGLQSDFRTGWARPIRADADLEITSIRVHPEYAKAVDQARQLHQQDEALREKFTGGEVGTDRDELAKALTDIDDRLITAYERQASFDIAVLEYAGKSPELLVLADSGSSAPPGTRLSIDGLPLAGKDEVFVDPERKATVVHVPSTVLLRLSPANDRALARLVVRCQENLAGQNWSGSPVMNNAGRVVGVYSRPTPPPFDATDRPAPATHDIVEIGKLQELTPELINRK